MPQQHCEIERLKDGTIIAHNPDLTLTILPNGKSKAFNRNFKQQTMLDKPLHAKLNSIAAGIQQKKITQQEAWQQVIDMVENQSKDPHERWLVGELDGVRVYINGSQVILTTQDLYK
jgi:hypothetical protein